MTEKCLYAKENKSYFSAIISFLSNIDSSLFHLIGQPAYGLDFLADTSLVGRYQNDINHILSNHIQESVKIRNQLSKLKYKVSCIKCFSLSWSHYIKSTLQCFLHSSFPRWIKFWISRSLPGTCFSFGMFLDKNYVFLYILCYKYYQN